MSRARDLADSADLSFDGSTLSIDSTNNRVGIGTSSPSQSLHVSGEGYFQKDSADSVVTLSSNGGSGRNWQVRSQSNGDFFVYDGTGGSSSLTIDSSANLKFNSGYGSAATAYGVRAWVNFVGTGTPAIRDSGNVSSITDNNTGDYTLNFSTALVDDDYAVSGMGSNENTNGNRGANGFMLGNNANMLSGSCTVLYSYGSTDSSIGALMDPDIATIMVVR